MERVNHMASIRERIDAHGKKTHQAQVRISGYPPQTKTFASKTDARRWAQQVEVDIQTGMYIRQSQSGMKTVANVMDEYERMVLPRKKRGGIDNVAALRYWRKHLGAYSLSTVTPKLIEDYRDRLARGIISGDKPVAAATVLRYMMALSSAFSHAVNWGWCEHNPVKTAAKPKVNNNRIRYLSDDEHERLLTACRASDNKDLYLVIVLALSTGMRKGEIMGMRWESIVFYDERGFAKLVLGVEDTKNSTQRSVLIASHAYELLRQRRTSAITGWAAHTVTGFVFPSAFNPSRPVDLRAPWKSALLKAKIKHFRFHDLRHTAASYLAMNGATTLEIKEALGHKSTAMAERYSHLSRSHVDEVVLHMNLRHFGNSKSQDRELAPESALASQQPPSR
jgi:integrase